MTNISLISNRRYIDPCHHQVNTGSHTYSTSLTASSLFHNSSTPIIIRNSTKSHQKNRTFSKMCYHILVSDHCHACSQVISTRVVPSCSTERHLRLDPNHPCYFGKAALDYPRMDQDEWGDELCSNCLRRFPIYDAIQTITTPQQQFHTTATSNQGFAEQQASQVTENDNSTKETVADRQARRDALVNEQRKKRRLQRETLADNPELLEMQQTYFAEARSKMQ